DIMTGLSSPYGVAVDAGGNVYVTQLGTGVVTRWDGATQTDIMTGLDVPYGVAVSSGNVYVAQFGAGVVTRWDGITQTDIITGLSSPAGVAVDSAGNVYVAQSSAGVVTKWDGNTTTNVITGLSSPIFLALTPVGPAVASGATVAPPRMEATAGLFEMTVASGSVVSGVVFEASAAMPTPDHGPLPMSPVTQQYTSAGNHTYNIPSDAIYIDIILLGGGAGGDGGTAAFGTGGGREAGKWASMTIQRGVDIGWNVTQIAITVG